jgi:hypothetical protein
MSGHNNALEQSPVAYPFDFFLAIERDTKNSVLPQNQGAPSLNRFLIQGRNTTGLDIPMRNAQ